MATVRNHIMFIGRFRSWLSAGTRVASRPKPPLDKFDRRRLKQLVDAYKIPAFRLTVSLTGDTAAAEDVLVVVFAKAYSADKRQSLRGLLGVYELAISECLRRCGSRLQALEIATTPLPGSRARVIRLLSQLSDRDRALLVLRDVMRHPLTELGGLFSISEEEVRAELVQARFALMRAWRSYEESSMSASLD